MKAALSMSQYRFAVVGSLALIVLVVTDSLEAETFARLDYSAEFDYRHESLLSPLGDFDQDGRLDLLTYRREVLPGGIVETKAIVVLRNEYSIFTDRPKFREIWELELPDGNPSAPDRLHIEIFDLQWVDYDGDNILDISVLLRNLRSGDFSLRLFRGNGSGDFSEVPVAGLPPNLTTVSSLDWVDFDRDGHLDVIVEGDGTEKERLHLFLRRESSPSSTETVAFVDVEAAFPNSFKTAVFPIWRDLDNDGDIDGLFQRDFTSKMLSNDGEFNFVSRDLGLPPSGSPGYRFQDIDTDGDLDAVSLPNCIPEWDISGPKGVFLNDGKAGFSKLEVDFRNGRPEPRLQRWIDIDRDGDLDALFLFGTRSFGTEVVVAEIWENQTNEGKVAPFTLVESFEIDRRPNFLNFRFFVAGDLDGDLDVDLFYTVRENDA
ncbi:MAG: VCBS repeat-containing protein [Verrucomicrobiota bacterium]